MQMKLDLYGNSEVLDFFNGEITKTSEGMRSFCCDILYNNIIGFLESQTLPRESIEKKKEAACDLMAYILCNMIMDCPDESHMLSTLELLSIYAPSDNDSREMLLHIPVKRLVTFLSLPPKKQYLSNIQQIRAKQYPLFFNYNQQLHGGIDYLVRSLTV